MSETLLADRLVVVTRARAFACDGRLREFRKRHGLSQREVARALRVSHTAVNRRETCDVRPHEFCAERLADLLAAFGEQP